jgi:hypothetical protein
MSMNGHSPEQDLSSYLKLPDGMSHVAVDDIEVRRQNEQQGARGYKFAFNYKGRVKKIEVWAAHDDTLSEIEERAAEEAELWMADLDEREYKRPPTEEERAQIGKSMNEFLLATKRRRQSSHGRLYFPGVN